jgi:hypothetical protein
MDQPPPKPQTRLNIRTDIHRHRRIKFVRDCRLNKMNEASFVPRERALDSYLEDHSQEQFNNGARCHAAASTSTIL